MMRFSLFARVAGVAVLLGVGAPPPLPAQSLTVTGRVTDTRLQPLPGVKVALQGDSTSARLTDISGSYSITVPQPSDTLVFAILGYDERRVAVEGRATLDVTLAPHPIVTEELVVRGYAQQSRPTISGSIDPSSTALPCDGAALPSPPSLEPREPPRRMSPPDPPSAPIPNACDVLTPGDGEVER